MRRIFVVFDHRYRSVIPHLLGTLQRIGDPSPLWEQRFGQHSCACYEVPRKR